MSYISRRIKELKSGTFAVGPGIIMCTFLESLPLFQSARIVFSGKIKLV